ncbi:MAG: hypothetical protein H6868_03060 [Rhodospirillales bacterium]|nr:hypothetical protein [Rhodospirillales bacterium]
MNKETSPIEHLYLFDDLSIHLKRISKEIDAPQEETEDLLEKVWSLILDSVKCIDLKRVDVNLINWEHACAQLAFQLKNANRMYDIMVSQGCNGEYAMRDLNSLHKENYGYLVAENTPNVRLAHLLDDPSDPFYSTFKLGTSKGRPLDEQINDVAEIARKMFQKRGTKIRLAVFDDCMGTGEGSKYVGEKLLEFLPDVPVSLHMVAFIGNESAMYRFQSMGFETHVGVLFRGKVYPESWKWDIYFLKDQFLSSAIRYTDGTSVPYMAGGWYDKIFAGNPEKATQIFHQVRDILSEAGYLAKLESM